MSNETQKSAIIKFAKKNKARFDERAHCVFVKYPHKSEMYPCYTLQEAKSVLTNTRCLEAVAGSKLSDEQKEMLKPKFKGMNDPEFVATHSFFFFAGLPSELKEFFYPVQNMTQNTLDRIDSYNQGAKYSVGETIMSQLSWTKLVIAKVDEENRMYVSKGGRAVSFDHCYKP